MKKFYTQKLLPAQPVNKALLRQVEEYINQRLPAFLQLNLEKGRQNPLSDFILITTRNQFMAQGYQSVNDYKPAAFEPDIEEVHFELSHYSKFNYWGQKIIVLILKFNIENNTCDFSIALFDDDAKRKVLTIEKDILRILQQHKKTVAIEKQLQPMAIE